MDDETAVTLRNEIIAAAQLRIDDISQQYISGAITLTAWVLLMRDEIEIAASQQYLLATGGEMTADDMDALETWIFNQHSQFLQGFGAEVQAGALTAGQVLVRAAMYAASTVTLYETAVASTRGATLPTYPGQTQCQSNCRCSWLWIDAGDVWHVIWMLDPAAAHCPDCLANASTYSESSPYVVVKSLSERIVA